MVRETLKVLKGIAVAGLFIYLLLLVQPVVTSLWLVVKAAILGNVVRVRAQYAQKEERPDAVDNREVMGVSFWRMLTRTFRVEGFSGLFRGIVLLASFTVIFDALFWFIGGPQNISNIDPVLRTILGYILIVLVNVPFSIFYIRIITISELLPFFSLCRGIKALLSSSERRYPWLLYLTPGLFLVIALDRAWDFILVPLLIKQIYRRIPAVDFTAISLANTNHIIAKIGLAVLDTLIRTPLLLATVRLAVQRNEDRAIVLSEDSGEEDLATRRAPVVRLRTQTEQPAYTGFFNCIASIVREEGFDTLYRVWWFTLLTGLVRVFVVGAKPEGGFKVGH